MRSWARTFIVERHRGAVCLGLRAWAHTAHVLYRHRRSDVSAVPAPIHYEVRGPTLSCDLFRSTGDRSEVIAVDERFVEARSRVRRPTLST